MPDTNPPATPPIDPNRFTSWESLVKAGIEMKQEFERQHPDRFAQLRAEFDHKRTSPRLGW